MNNMNKIDFKSQYGYLEALEALKPKWSHLWMNDKLMNEDNLPLNFQSELMIFLLGFNHTAKKHDLILRNGLSYNDIINSARQLHLGELQHVTILDTLRQMVVTLKDKELSWDIKYHKLAASIDVHLDIDMLEEIYSTAEETFEPMVRQDSFIIAKASREWNKSHRLGLENALIEIVKLPHHMKSRVIAMDALSQHSLRYCKEHGINWFDDEDKYKL